MDAGVSLRAAALSETVAECMAAADVRIAAW